MLLKIIKNEFRQMLHPNAVLPMRVDGTNVPSSKRVTLLAFLSTYLILCLFCSFSMIAMVRFWYSRSVRCSMNVCMKGKMPLL